MGKRTCSSGQRSAKVRRACNALARWEFRCAQNYRAEELEPRTLLAGVTLITHGFNDDAGGWVTSMANAIAASPTLAQRSVYTVTVSDGSNAPGTDMNPISVTATFNTVPATPTPDQSSNPEVIVLLDWKALAGTVTFSVSPPTYGGHYRNTVDVAAKVSQKLLTAGFLPGMAAPAASLPMHLIGHSRGGSLVSELSKDLGASGVWVDQVTTLDPHPLNSLSQGADWGDATPNAYDNVVFADNYWRADGLDITEPGDVDGQPVSGAHNVPLAEETLEEAGAGYHGAAPGHLDVHLWYNGTIGPLYPSTDGTSDFPTAANWYLSPQPAKEVSGFHFSRIGGGTQPADGVGAAFGGTASRVGVTRSGTGTQWSNIGDIALLYNASGTLTIGNQIFLSYLAQDYDSTAAITWYADKDQNPFDVATQKVLGTQTIGASGSTVTTGMFHASTAGLDVSYKYIYAQITDAAGHTRYAYLPNAVTFTAAQTTPSITSGQTKSGNLGPGDMDVYTFTAAAANTHISLAMGTSGFGPQIDLYDPSGVLLKSAVNVSFNGTGTGLDATTDLPGIYYAVARAGDKQSTGTYSLTLIQVPAIQAIDGIDGGPITSGQTKSGNLGPGDMDVYTFTAAAANTHISLAMGTSGFSPQVDLYDPSGVLLKAVVNLSFNGTGTGLDATTDLPGTYYVVARAGDKQSTGTYSLTLIQVPATQAIDGIDGGPITSGQTKSGNLGAGDMDVYTFTAAANDAFTLSMSSSSISPQVDVYGPTGNLIISASGSPATINSQITPDSGVYYVIARDHNAIATGGYTLTLSGALHSPNLTTITGTVGGDQFTIVQSPDHAHINWTFGTTLGQMSINDPSGLTINGNGGSDSVILDYTNGNPFPNTLHLNGTFTINGLSNTNPFAGTTLEIGRSTVFINYGDATADAATKALIKTSLANGLNGGAWNGVPTASTGVITSTPAKNNPNHNTGIGWADSSDGTGANTTPNTIELKYTLNGDATLNGVVDIFDLNALLPRFNNTGDWTNGDSTYNGVVDIFDLNALLPNFNTVLGAQITPAISGAAASTTQTAAVKPTTTTASPSPVTRTADTSAEDSSLMPAVTTNPTDDSTIKNRVRVPKKKGHALRI